MAAGRPLVALESTIITHGMPYPQNSVMAADVEKIIADKKAFVERFRAKASKARQAQSRVKQIEKIEVETLAASSRRYPKFRFEIVRPRTGDTPKMSKQVPVTSAPTTCVAPPFAATLNRTPPLWPQTSANGVPSRESSSTAGIGVSCS